MIVLYHAANSRSSAMRWLLEELGVPYDTVDVDISEGHQRTPLFLAINPMGKVPAVLDGETAVSETAAIAIYLCDKYKSPVDLAPAVDDPQRAAYLRWMVFQPGCLEPALMQRHLGFATARMQASWGDYELVVDVLEDALGRGPYLLGDRFTAADVVLGAGVNFGLMFNLLEARPALVAYRDRLVARPAFQRSLG